MSPAIDTGFDLGGQFPLAIVGFGIAVLAAIGALSHQQERAFSASIIYLVLGVLGAGALSILGVSPIDPVRDASLIEHVTELALAIAVFSTGLAIERRLTWGGWRVVALLIGGAMPLSIAAVALFGALGMGLSLGAAIILGSVVAPTDPVLAGDIGVSPPGEDLEGEARFNLGTEAALNDGLASPFVVLGIFVAREGGTHWLSHWAAADLVYATAAGALLGAAAGYLMGRLAIRLRDGDLLDQRLDFYFAVPTVLVVYGAAELLGGYGLVAAFAAGLAFRRYERGHEYNRHVHEGAEVVEKFAELVVILVLGTMVTVSGLKAPGLSGWLLVPLLLLVIRPALTFALLTRSHLSLRERAFVAWFGVRGVAAVYYAVVVIGAGVLSRAEETTVFWTAAACVLVSIVVHGMSASPLERRLLER